jgi:hypothetical protein
MRLTLLAVAATVVTFAALGPVTAGAALARPFVIAGGWTCSMMSGPEAALVMADTSLAAHNRVQVCTRRFNGEIQFSVTPLDLSVGNGSAPTR